MEPIVERDLMLRSAEPADVAVLQAMVGTDLGDRWTCIMYDGGRRHVDSPGVGLQVVERGGRTVGLLETRVAEPGRGPVELGWWIAPGERGRHTASRAVGLAVDGLRRRGAPRIEARIAVGNERSRWVAASAGLHLEATLLSSWDDDSRPGARIDVEVWRLLSGEERLEPQPELSAGALHLRALRPTDVPAIVAACQDPVSQRWLPALPVPYREEEGRQFVSRQLSGWASGADTVWGFCDSVTGELLGCVGLHPRGAGPGWREVGWHCFPPGRGHGHTAQAAGAVARWGHAALGLHRIDARIEPGNAASIRVAQKAGFSHEATLASSVSLRGGAAGPAQVWLWS